MNGSQLKRAGELLHGHFWRAPFETEFGVGNRALRRMLAGRQEIPDGLAREIETSLRDHNNAVDALLDGINT